MGTVLLESIEGSRYSASPCCQLALLYMEGIEASSDISLRWTFHSQAALSINLASPSSNLLSYFESDTSLIRIPIYETSHPTSAIPNSVLSHPTWNLCPRRQAMISVCPQSTNSVSKVDNLCRLSYLSYLRRTSCSIARTNRNTSAYYSPFSPS